MDVLILLATYRRPTMLSRTLESLRELRTAGLAYEVLVVDNSSPRETEAALAHAAAGLPVRHLVETTRGKNHALNRAIPEARGALVVFTDDDVVMDPDWLLELAGGAQRWPDHSVFGGRVLPLWPAEGAPSLRHNYYLRAGLPVVSEAPVPNNHLITESGLGLIAPYGDESIMAEMIEAAALRPWDRRAAQAYVLAHHTWDRRAQVYERILTAEFGLSGSADPDAPRADLADPRIPGTAAASGWRAAPRGREPTAGRPCGQST